MVRPFLNPAGNPVVLRGLAFTGAQGVLPPRRHRPTFVSVGLAAGTYLFRPALDDGLRVLHFDQPMVFTP